MASVALLGANFSTTGGTATVTATPAVDDLIVIVAMSTGLAGGPTAASDNNSGGAGTYTQVDTDRTGFSTTGVLTVWIRTAKIAAAASTVFTSTQVGSTGGGLAVFAVKQIATLGAAAVRSAGGQSAVAAATPAPVLAQLPNPRNPIITAVAASTNSSPAATGRTGYTITSGNFNTPATNISIGTLDSGERTDTITWGGATAGVFASFAIELDTQQPNRGVVNFQFPGVFAKARQAQRRWKQRASGILVPDGVAFNH